MGDGCSFLVVAVPYRTFVGRWQRALRGGLYWRCVMRAHRVLLGVHIRARPRFMPVVYRTRGGRLRRAYLNPTQIVYAEQP